MDAQGMDSVDAYFPHGVWYSIRGDATVDASTSGRMVRLPVPVGDVQVHVLGGSIIPLQVS